MPIREFPKSDDIQEHQDWVADATIEELNAYIPRYSATPTFYRMAIAQREKLHFELKNKIEAYWTPKGIKQIWHNSFWGKICVAVVAGIILIFILFAINKFIFSATVRPNVTISLVRIDYGALKWPDNPKEYSYTLLELEVTNEEEHPIPLPSQPFNVSVKINHEWVSFEKMTIPLSGTVLYASEQDKTGANIDHMDLQKFRELNVSRLYGHYSQTIRKKDQYLNSRHYLLSQNTAVSPHQLKIAFENIIHNNDIPIKISWQDMRGRIHEPYLVVHKSLKVTSGFYKVYAKKVKYF